MRGCNFHAIGDGLPCQGTNENNLPFLDIVSFITRSDYPGLAIGFSFTDCLFGHCSVVSTAIVFLKKKLIGVVDYNIVMERAKIVDEGCFVIILVLQTGAHMCITRAYGLPLLVYDEQNVFSYCI